MGVILGLLLHYEAPPWVFVLVIALELLLDGED